MASAGNAARDAILANGGNLYASAPGYSIGIDGGVMPDWTYTISGILSFTIELDHSSFVRPPEKILPVAREGLSAVQAFSKFVMSGGADALRWIPPTPSVSTSQSPSQAPSQEPFQSHTVTPTLSHRSYTSVRLLS